MSCPEIVLDINVVGTDCCIASYFSGSAVKACDLVDCGEHGECDEKDGECQCTVGWGGEHCDVELCPEGRCGENGTCNNETGSCLCEPEYFGENCENRIKCLPSKYCGYGVCDEDSGGCVCDYGWEGQNCTTKNACVCKGGMYRCTDKHHDKLWCYIDSWLDCEGREDVDNLKLQYHEKPWSEAACEDGALACTNI